MTWAYEQIPFPRVYGAMKSRYPIRAIPDLTPRQLRNFWKKITKTDGCWEWTGAKSVAGYGTVSLGWDRFYAHRVAYTIAHGAIPDGLTIDHLCRNHACVNPEHLDAVALGINILRSDSPIAKNAAKTHCSKGHPITEPGQYVLDGGGRKCSICKHDKEARYRAERRYEGRYTEKRRVQRRARDLAKRASRAQ